MCDCRDNLVFVEIYIMVCFDLFFLKVKKVEKCVFLGEIFKLLLWIVI